MGLFDRNVLRRALSVAAALSAAACWLVCDDGNPSGGGDSYASVKIGGRVWMKKNLDIATGGSTCYDNDPDKCAKYGRLYNWNAATTACPSGWKLPNRADWNSLVDAAGGSVAGRKLKAKSGWDYYGGIAGTDDYGFSALPGGYYYNGTSSDAGSMGRWWINQAYDVDLAYVRSMTYQNDDAPEGYTSKTFYLSVRCIKEN